jgi:hypothetical protein
VSSNRNTKQQGPVVIIDKHEDGKIWVITMNRPHRMNALGDGMATAMSDALEAYRDDKMARVAIITGAGDRAFCAGADLIETAEIRQAHARGEKPQLKGMGGRSLVRAEPHRDAGQYRGSKSFCREEATEFPRRVSARFGDHRHHAPLSAAAAATPLVREEVHPVSKLNPNTPVLVGIGVISQRQEDPTAAKEAIALMVDATRAAAADAGAPDILKLLDYVYVPQGRWQYKNPAGLVARAVGASNATTVLAKIGIL